jgi:hypothetical protein
MSSADIILTATVASVSVMSCVATLMWFAQWLERRPFKR